MSADSGPDDGRQRATLFADFPLQAIGLAAGVTAGHPFVDGNKRTAVLALEQFLLYNGLQLAASDDQLFEWILALTNGLDPGELAEQLRPFVVPAIPL